MSAPLLWIVFPGLLGGLLALFSRATRAVLVTGLLASVFLALSALILPIEDILTVGNTSIRLNDTFTVLGRGFTLTNAERPLLAGFYILLFLWVLGTVYARPPDLFIPVAFAVVALFIAALAVEPFLYAALLIEVCVLLLSPILAQDRGSAWRSVSRFLIFQTIGMPFILFTGWMLAGVEAGSSEFILVARAAILMGLGFAFLLAIFPFHSWIPMLAQEANPYVAGFVFLMLPGVVAFFALSFIDRYTWLRESQSLFLLIRWVGVLMVLTGGGLAAFESHLGRMLGHGVVAETGIMLLAVSLNSTLGISLFFALILPRAISIWFWSLSLARLRNMEPDRIRVEQVRGLLTTRPLVSVSILLAHFSIAGFPLLAGFPTRVAVFTHLSAIDPFLASLALVGTLGLIGGGIRTLNVFVAVPVPEDQAEVEAPPPEEDLPEILADQPRARELVNLIMLILAGTGSILVGILPNWFWPFFNSMPAMFEFLGR